MVVTSTRYSTYDHPRRTPLGGIAAEPRARLAEAASDQHRHRSRQPKAAFTPGAALASSVFCFLKSPVQFLARTLVFAPGRSHVLVLARHRRVRGVTLTRLSASGRCHIHVASRRPMHLAPHRTRRGRPRFRAL